MAGLPRSPWKTFGSTLLLLSGLGAAGCVFGQPVPRILTNGIVNGAGAPLAPAPLAPGSIIAIYGSNFNSSPGTHAGGLSATSAPLPTILGGTQLLINSRLAPLYYADSTQINAQVPWEVNGASYLTVQVIVNGLPSNLSTVALTAIAPGISVVTHGLDGSLVTSSQPATPGEYLTIYATGLGQVTNRPATGAAASVKPLSTTPLTPTLMIGGIVANVIFSGLTPGFSGLYQVNAQVPAGTPNGGDIAVVLSVGSAVSNTITTSVQSGMASGVQVSISPVSASLLTGATQQFTPGISGTNNSAVNWAVNGIPGGNSGVGTISAGGLYVAPATAPSSSVVFVAATTSADSTVAGTATVAVSAPPPLVSPLGRVRSNGPGLGNGLEQRGNASGYWPGQTIQSFNDFDPFVGSTVAQEVSLQLDKIKAIGVSAISFGLQTTKASDAAGGPFVPPACPEPPPLGLQWPQPTAVELTNLKAFFDLVGSKEIRIRLGLNNTHMEEQPPTNSQTYLGAVLGAIGTHPALDMINFDGSPFLIRSGPNGVLGECGPAAEAELWLGPDDVAAKYIQWVIGYAQSLGVPAQKLSAEAIVGNVYTDSLQPNQFSTDGHLWNPVTTLKTIFDRAGIPDNQRTYALSFYEHTKCATAANLPCTDLDPHAWAEQTLQNLYAVIGTQNGARVIANELGGNKAFFRTEQALESEVALLEKYRIEGASFWRWVHTTNSEDSDPTLDDAVKRRGINFVYNPVQKEVLDWGGFHLTAIPNGSFEDDLDSNGVPTHWAVTGKGSASAYYLPLESGQPQVPSRGSYCLRLTASDTAAAISATSDRIAVTPSTSYTTTANLRFAWGSDPNPSASASTRPQVFITIHYLNASGQAAAIPSTAYSYFRENSTQGFQTFVFEYTTPSDARSVQIELGAARNGLAVPIVVDVDNLR